MKKLYTLLFTVGTLSATAQETIQKTLYHEFGQSKLTVNAQRELAQLLQQLKEMDVSVVRIKSHADKVGNYQFNRQLSQQRYLSVLQMFRKQLPETVSYDVSNYGEDSLLTLSNEKQAKNRRTEITILYSYKVDSKSSEVTNLVPYHEDVKEQRFEINLDDTVSITANEGTFIKFSPGSFQNKKRELAKGKAVLLIKEYYKPGDILLSGMHSVSDTGLLQTGGMFKLLVVQQQDTMLAETRKPVKIKIPDINNLTGTMNVFTKADSDSSLWNDAQRSFTRVSARWDWPVNYPKLQEFMIDKQIPFEKWEIGRKLSNEYYISGPIIYWGEKRKFVYAHKPLAKYVSYKITKTDSTTLTVNLFEKFRRRGYKRFGTKTFDTTFFVRYSSAFYETTLSTINYINCDRFLNYPQVTDLYVRTPNFDGAQILVYFKNINAFMQAEYKDGNYRVRKVPAGEDVYLIAVGKRGDEFYYGKKAYTISRKANIDLALEKVQYNEMKEMFSSLGFKN